MSTVLKFRGFNFRRREIGKKLDYFFVVVVLVNGELLRDFERRYASCTCEYCNIVIIEHTI